MSVQVRRDVISRQVRRSVLSDCVPSFVLVNLFDQARINEFRYSALDCGIGYPASKQFRVHFDTLHAQCTVRLLEDLKDRIIATSHPSWSLPHLVRRLIRHNIIAPNDPQTDISKHHYDAISHQHLLPTSVSGWLTRNSRGPEAQLSAGPIKNGLDADTSVRVDSRETGTKAMLANEFGVLESPRTGVASTIEHYPHALAGGDR